MTSTQAASDTPTHCIADFSLIPIGSEHASFSKIIAGVHDLVKESGLNSHMHATGTIIEGPWDEVVRLIGVAHILVHHSGVPRIQTDIRITTRTDKKQPMEEIIRSSERAERAAQ